MRERCVRCGKARPLSKTTGKCEPCLYAEEFGQARADEQVARAAADRERAKPQGKARPTR